MNDLKFRRQFLFSPRKCGVLNSWKCEKIFDYNLYVHPDCQLHKKSGNSDVYLIGHVIDPHSPEKSISEIVYELSAGSSSDFFIQILYKLVGRFVLIVKLENDLFFFNDACGLRMFFYIKIDGQIYAASQPLLIKEVLNIQESSSYATFYNSSYVKNNIEHWLPSGISLFKDVYHLVPNHYVNLSETKQIRYWPNKNLVLGDYQKLLKEFIELLNNIIIAANNNMDLAFTLTAGWDSRILLSCCKKLRDDIIFYTLQYRSLLHSNPDLYIPSKLAKSLNLNFNIIDCRKELSKDFWEIYKNNTHIPHNDWAAISYGMIDDFPSDKIAVKGNCSEIGRCFYYNTGKHKKHLTERDFVSLEKYWHNLEFVNSRIREWFLEINDNKNNYGYDLYDLFYWEHRMGSWQAQSQLEGDIIQETFTPFNSRELIDIMLSIKSTYRKANNPQLYIDTMSVLWKDVLLEQINPLSNKKKIIRLIKNFKKKFD